MMNIVTGRRIFYIDVTLHSNTDKSCMELRAIIYSFIYVFYWICIHCSDIALNFIPQWTLFRPTFLIIGNKLDQKSAY